MDSLDHIQFSLFQQKDMAPKPSLKKVLTKERIKEVNDMLKARDNRNAYEMLRDLNHDLEAVNRRIHNRNYNDSTGSKK
jgi:hypothetical protein